VLAPKVYPTMVGACSMVGRGVHYFIFYNIRPLWSSHNFIVPFRKWSSMYIKHYLHVKVMDGHSFNDNGVF
jgi:hypothetical protein